MDVWKEFEKNAVTHSVAHHLVAIATLRDEFGYARVSDVARQLSITRGSASITLKGLKQRGLVIEDARRFLGLSEDGLRIARTIQAKKKVMRRLFVEWLGVDDEQADIDTCKIEHLISGETASAALRMLRFLEAGGEEVAGFLREFERFAGRTSTDESLESIATEDD